LIEAERQAGVLADVVRESAQKLLVASVEHASAAQSQAEAASAAAIGEAEEFTAKATAALERAGQLAGEAIWCAQLRTKGVVPPYTGTARTQPSPRALGVLQSAIAAFGEDAHSRATARAKIESERAAEAKLRVPPGTTIWKEGQTFVVDAEGVPQEVERGRRATGAARGRRAFFSRRATASAPTASGPTTPSESICRSRSSCVGPRCSTS
jgi:hypothetical protein